jgi:hypothetical protein
MPGSNPGIVFFEPDIPQKLRRWAACARHPAVINWQQKSPMNSG